MGNVSWWAQLNKFNKMAIHVHATLWGMFKALNVPVLAAMRVFKLKLNNACQNCQGSGAREGKWGQVESRDDELEGGQKRIPTQLSN